MFEVCFNVKTVKNSYYLGQKKPCFSLNVQCVFETVCFLNPRIYYQSWRLIILKVTQHKNLTIADASPLQAVFPVSPCTCDSARETTAVFVSILRPPSAAGLWAGQIQTAVCQGVKLAALQSIAGGQDSAQWLEEELPLSQTPTH